MQSFMDEMRQMDPVSETSSALRCMLNPTPVDFTFTVAQADPSLPVLVAGDPERAQMRKVKESGGIFYHKNVVKAMVGIG